MTKTSSARHWRGPTSIESGRASGARADGRADVIGGGANPDDDDALLNVEEVGAASSLAIGSGQVDERDRAVSVLPFPSPVLRCAFACVGSCRGLG